MSESPPNDPFNQEIQQLRADYEGRRNRSNLNSTPDQQIIDLSLDVVDGVLCYTYWYEPSGQCIRLADIPGTLSGDILHLLRNIPVLEGDHEIIGDQICPLKNTLPLPELDDDSEELGTVLASLPVIKVNSSKHFVKEGKYQSEIRNLLKCQGGSCPGVPKSSHIIQLLGRSPDGKLVFEKFKPRYVLVNIYPLAVYTDWILQILSGLKCLHSLGIVHRDLRIDNIVFSSDTSRVLICDLESCWGNCLAPEVSRKPVLDAG
ncbi:uncharacterized protein N7483_012925 [Penicillium malachiteum]|uniref:uncharacterized protein n=1 Tax=Penicillium malachiteum TaxID=1324776 RepID=UPI002548EED5|nr:uncharacterized protein N7483_012925 [Penicillium malachiteum]KAJ5715744.1 hypothetical protein N7483_012925 [Penicillium malachiteum]